MSITPESPSFYLSYLKAALRKALHCTEPFKHPPLQHFLYKFSDFVNDRPMNYENSVVSCGITVCGTSRNIYGVFKNPPGVGERSACDLLHFRYGFKIKMNFNRNVSCLIAVYGFMDNDFFNQAV